MELFIVFSLWLSDVRACSPGNSSTIQISQVVKARCMIIGCRSRPHLHAHSAVYIWAARRSSSHPLNLVRRALKRHMPTLAPKI
jgi:hypothetical protein